MFPSPNRGISVLPPPAPEPPVRYVLGHRTRRGMSQKDPQGRVKVYRDKHRCWADAKREFGKKIGNYDVFGMDQESWDRFRTDVKHVEVGGEPVPAPEA